MTFTFSQRSEEKLKGVHPDLVRVVRYALTISTVDFGVLQGVRTLEEEQANFDKGLSRISPNQSRHLRGLAVDVGAFVNGVLTWDWNYYNLIADAFREASYAVNVPIRWGGAWDVELTKSYTRSEAMHNDYVQRFMRENPGRKPLVDGGHFELPVKEYP